MWSMFCKFIIPIEVYSLLTHTHITTVCTVQLDNKNINTFCTDILVPFV